MDIAIFGGAKTRINFFPKSVLEEIIQNIETLLNTEKYSVPLDRELGVDLTLIDKPMEWAKVKLSVEIIDAIRRYEPRVIVNHVDYKPQNEHQNAKLVPIVEVTVIEEQKLS